MLITWIIVAIIIFTIIVIIHELWHFSAARFFGVKVEEFWIWIPPKAKDLFTDKKWTKYSLNWFPFWGFVRLKGENEESPPPSPLPCKEGEYHSTHLLKDRFIDKGYFAKSVILLAGVFMNFLLAIIIFSILFFIWVKPIWINTQIETNLDLKIIPTYSQAIQSWLLKEKKWVILYPVKNSIAQKAWIKENDILLEINNKKINSPEDLIRIVSKNAWKKIILKIKNKNHNLSKKIELQVGKNWKIGSYVSKNIILNKNFEYKYSLLDSIKYWALETYNQSLLTLKWLKILAQKIIFPEKKEERKEALESMKWPIWIVDIITNSLDNWVKFLLILAAIISINLWVFNLLPIPALDWWRFFLISINTFFSKIFKKKAISSNIENIIHLFFFLILISLTILISYNDIVNWK